MSDLVREIWGLVEAFNKATPLAIAALAFILAILEVWKTGGS